MKGRRMGVVLWPCLMLLTFSLPYCKSTEQVPAAASPQIESERVPVLVEERDLVYANVEGKELLLDLIYPENTDRQLPLVIFIFGSEHSFHMASKINLYYAALEAAKRGYVAANITYRTTLEKIDGKSLYEFPTQVHDAKCAVRWLKAHGERYGIDVNRVVFRQRKLAPGVLLIRLRSLSPAQKEILLNANIPASGYGTYRTYALISRPPVEQFSRICTIVSALACG